MTLATYCFMFLILAAGASIARLVFRDGEWSAVVNIGSDINSSAHRASPPLPPDGRHLFFLSEREGESRIYWVKR